MRVVVQGLIIAAGIIVASGGYDADAARYDNVPTTLPSIDAWQLSLSPFIGGFARPARPAEPKAGPLAFLPEMALFNTITHKVPGSWVPRVMPGTLLPEITPGYAYVVPVETAKTVSADEVPETVPEVLPSIVYPSNRVAEAEPLNIRSHRHARISKESQLANVQRIQFDAPTLAPLAHTRFCFKYPSDCRAHKLVFRGGELDLDATRRSALIRINAGINRAIRPERVNETVAGEKWLISPKSGDCNDYAVTKRHELLKRGWPARSLLLAEVITSWGEHHLVLVVRARQGDFVLDSLNREIRPWSKTPYQWVRVETPANPLFWSTVKAPRPEVVAMAGHDREL